MPNALPNIDNLLDVLEERSARHPDREVLTFLGDDGAEVDRLSYADLALSARSIAGRLAASSKRDARVILLFPPSLDFVRAYWGCLYAGRIAVPVFPPIDAGSAKRFMAVLRDARPDVVLTTRAILTRTRFKRLLSPPLWRMRWLALEDIEPAQAYRWQRPDVAGRSVAMLQYTSGSTGAPKGVVVTHANLIHNARVVDSAWHESFTGADADSSLPLLAVSWLPLYHNMGLSIALGSVIIDSRAILMSALTFLQRPYRWPEAISRYRATFSAAPNFAYEMCARRVTDDERSTLELSSWLVAMNGGEPVRPATLELFASRFRANGFRASAFWPCYGIAESTALVTAGPRAKEPVVFRADREALGNGHCVEAGHEEPDAGVAFIGCGRPWVGQETVVVDPDRREPCGERDIGEIWLSGPSVAQGYWRRDEETAETFGAHLAHGQGPFLRTGDLGFQKDEHLFITGRIKDLIIIRGKNHYPHDIEQTAQQCTAARSSGAAAFSVDADGEERLVVVQEVLASMPTSDYGGIARKIRQQVVIEHGIPIHSLALSKPGAIPRTSTGKIQRRQCRQQFLDGTLDVVWKG